MSDRNELDLPTILEECAEHLRAGRDPFRQFEAYDGGGWRQTLNYMELASYAVNGKIRRKPTHKTPTEDDVGRLVMVRDSDAQDWRGPYVLKEVSAAGYRTSQYMPYGQAKLYTGPTRPNWIEHDGRGVPEAVRGAGKVVVQLRGNFRGDWTIAMSFSSGWEHGDLDSDIMRYTIINP